MKKIDAWLMFSSASIKKKTDDGYISELIKKAEKIGLNIEIKNLHLFSILTKNGNELYYDGQLVTQLPKIAIVRRYEIYLTRQLELMGVKVINTSDASCNARNKMKIHQILAANNISTPATVFSCFKNNFNNISYEKTVNLLNSSKFIVKWIYGSQGKHVYLVKNKEEFDKLVIKYKGRILCQEYIEDSFGMDIRAYVINGKFLTAAIRRNDGTDFRSNLAQGGSAEEIICDEKLIYLAESAARTTGLDICGVDILKGKDNYYICEVNSNPGFKSVKKIHNIDERDVFLNLIKEKVK